MAKVRNLVGSAQDIGRLQIVVTDQSFMQMYQTLQQTESDKFALILARTFMNDSCQQIRRQVLHHHVDGLIRVKDIYESDNRVVTLDTGEIGNLTAFDLQHLDTVTMARHSVDGFPYFGLFRTKNL